MCNSTRFEVFEDLHLTFHIGDAGEWRSDQYAEYEGRNMAEYQRVLAHHRPRLEKLDEAQLRELSMTRRRRTAALSTTARTMQWFSGGLREVRHRVRVAARTESIRRTKWR
jgi:hypothetical protein